MGTPENRQPDRQWEGLYGLRQLGVGRIHEDEYYSVEDTNQWLRQVGLVEMADGETIEQWHRRAYGEEQSKGESDGKSS